MTEHNSTASEARDRRRSIVRQREYRAVAFLLTIGLIGWIAQSAVNYYSVHDSTSAHPLVDYLFSREMAVSIVGVICFLGYGIYVSRMVAEMKRTEEEREQLIRELAEAKAYLYHEATHDKLTGLWNRAAILDTLQRELARATRENTSVGLILADVDHFKQINDENGHLAGDAVLQAVAERILASVRAYDAAGRYGGEEFIMVLPGCDKERVMGIAERLRSEFSDRPTRTGAGDFSVTMSFGAVSVNGSADPTSESLIRAADEALYHAKRTGRNRVVYGAEAW